MLLLDRSVAIGALIATIVVGLPSAKGQEGEIGPAYYLGLGFALLDADERAVFVDLAELQSSPCVGEPQNLSLALLDYQQRCRLAEEVASLMMRRIKEDDDPALVRDAVARFISEALTPREFELEQSPQHGPDDAPIQVVIFSDFGCPHCRRVAEVLDELLVEFGDQLVVYYKHFPLPQHASALVGARACVAAQRQGRFWEMHDVLFANQQALSSHENPEALVRGFAEEIGLDMTQFDADFADESSLQVTVDDRDEGRAMGINSTPTCYVNGIEYREIETIESLRAYFNDLL